MSTHLLSAAALLLSLTSFAGVAGGSTAATAVPRVSEETSRFLPVQDEESDPLVAADPLEVTLREVVPSAIPRRGRLQLEGTIRNVSEQTWTDLQIFGLSSAEPLTTSVELADALGTPADMVFGERLAEEGLFDEIAALAPGASATFSLRIPRNELEISGEEGLYWLGVQVLGTADGVRLDGSDGRDRVLMPLIEMGQGPQAEAPTRVSVTWPQRSRVGYDSAGVLLGPRAHARDFAEQGRLGQIASVIAATAESASITAVVDPALVEAAKNLAQPAAGWALRRRGGEPAPTGEPDDQDKPTGEPSASAEQPSDSPGKPEASGAGAWVEAITSAGNLWSLPYGDPDVAALAEVATDEQMTDILSRAEQGAVRALPDQVLTQPVLMPKNGSLSLTELQALGERTILVPRSALPEQAQEVIRLAGGATLRAYETAALTPGQRTTWLQLRQRLLAQAALVALGDAQTPALINLSSGFSPVDAVDAERFAAGLEQPWLRYVPPNALPALTTPSPTPNQDEDDETAQSVLPDDSEIVFGGEVEFDDGVWDAALEVLSWSESLRSAIDRPALIAQQLERSALVALSASQLDRGVRMQRRLARTSAAMQRLLDSVVVAPPNVFRAGVGDGRMQIVVINDLNTSLTLELRSRPVQGITVTPPERFEIASGKRRTIALPIRVERSGRFAMVIELATPNDRVVATSKPIRVRGLQQNVGMWVLLGIGILFIGVTAKRRIREGGRKKHEPPAQTGSEA